MKYDVGQRVVFMHDVGGGVICEIQSTESVLVEDEDGFKRPFNVGDIAPVANSAAKSIVPNELREETVSKNGIRKPMSKKSVQPGLREIDLHIEELVESHSGWSNARILQRQFHAFKSFFHKACRDRVPKIVIIHGVGEGVLKSEICSFLREENGVHFYDADFNRYGRGATAVEIRHTMR